MSETTYESEMWRTVRANRKISGDAAGHSDGLIAYFGDGRDFPAAAASERPKCEKRWAQGAIRRDHTRMAVDRQTQAQRVRLRE